MRRREEKGEARWQERGEKRDKEEGEEEGERRSPRAERGKGTYSRISLAELNGLHTLLQ